MTDITVTKASGDLEPYKESKLRYSLFKAGADKHIIDHITEAVYNELYEGISTKEIYQKAFEKLRGYSKRSAGRYKLKNAILELGPTGYPFEKFIGELFRHLGYKTQVGIIAEGDCVSHEIDVIAEKDTDQFMIECKFHNRKGLKCNVQVPLYIQSRFLDIQKKWKTKPAGNNTKHRAWLVTNTKFSNDALQYGECMGIKMLSWDYPYEEGLKELIDRVNVHPITCLSSLSKKDKRRLLEIDVILCKQIFEDKQLLKMADIDTRKINRVYKEASAICNRVTTD
jgi:hypothetical protein